MRTKILITFFIVAVSFQTGIFGQEGKKNSAAILPFSVGGEITQKEINPITQWFIGAFISTNKYLVLERSKMDEILKEQDFTLSDQCNSAECAVQIGKLLAAEKIIQGDIGKFGETYAITIKIIDVSTSKIEKLEKERYKGAKDGLLEVLTVMAQKLAGTYKAKKNYTWYYIGGALVAGGGAAALLLGKKQSAAGLPFPPNPPN